MDLGLKDRVALVAASSRGLGRAAAEALAAEGARLALCARNEKVLAATAESIRQRFGVPVLDRALDVTDRDAVKKFVDATIERFGRVDIGIANAGGPPSKAFADTAIEDWEQAFALNFMSTLYLVRELLPHMQKQKWGRIITITSITVKQPTEGLILSNAIRAAVAGLVKSLANEYAADNILINNVCPGFTATDRLHEVATAQAAAQGVTREEIVSRWSRNIPLGRLGRPEEFASVVAFLCSEKASYVTGASIAIDGGVVKGIL
ncbi:MAG TPA: SDR family oxidoreductase [Bryobacterales bacterium]|nr:SDR family oxidoreductase [Bryobacterales bacterium]